MEEIDIASLNFDTSNLMKQVVDTRKEIDLLAGSLTASRKSIKDSQKQVDELTKANEELAKSVGKDSEEYKENQKAIDNLNESIEKSTADVIKNESARRDLNSQQRTLTKLLDLQNKTQIDNTLIVNQATEALKLNWQNQEQAGQAASAMLGLRKQLNPEIAEEARLMEELSKKVDEANEFQKLYNSENENRVSGIGQYKDAILQAAGATGMFSKNAGSMGGSVGGAINGINGLSKATLGFTSIPLVFVITSIVQGLKFLYDRFVETESGMDQITKVTRPLTEVFQTLMGIFQNISKLISGEFTKAWDDPLDAIKRLGDFIQENLINRLQGFIVIWNSLKKGNLKGIADGVIQIGTGITDATDKMKDFVNEMGEAVERGKQIDALTKEIRDNEIALSAARQQAKIDTEKINEQLKDGNKTYKERAELANQRLAIEEKLEELENKHIDNQIKLFDLESIATENSTADDQRRQDLVNKRKQNELDVLKLRTANQRYLSGAIKEEQQQQAEAHKKRMAEILATKNAELDYFILLNKNRQSGLKEEIDFEKEVSRQRLEILDQELKNKTKSDLEYRNAKAQLEIASAEREAEIVLFYATQEVNEQIKALTLIQEEKKRYTLENVEFEKTAINEIAEAELLNAQSRLEANLINRHEYNDLVFDIEKQQKERIKELDDTFEEQQTEDRKLRQLLEHEERLLNIENQFEIEQELLSEQRRLEFEALEELKNEELISEENYLKKKQFLIDYYASKEKEINKKTTEYKIQQYASVLGEVSKLLGEETAAGKFFAAAQTLINTYTAAQESYKVGAAIGGPIVGGIFAATATAAGLKNVANIMKVKTEAPGGSFYTGGKTANVGKYTDAGTVHGGEVVFSQDDVRMLGGADVVDSMRPTSGANSNNMPLGGKLLGAENDNFMAMAEIFGEAVYNGTKMGTNSGMVELSDDIDVMNKSIF